MPFVLKANFLCGETDWGLALLLLWQNRSMDLTPPNNAVDNRWIWGQIMCNIISWNQIMKPIRVQRGGGQFFRPREGSRVGLQRLRGASPLSPPPLDTYATIAHYRNTFWWKSFMALSFRMDLKKLYTGFGFVGLFWPYYNFLIY